MKNPDNHSKQIAKWIRQVNKLGWSPGTSTNYSFKHSNTDENIIISKSGVDKSYFTSKDFILVDKEGNVTNEYQGTRPSAETLIHCELYQLFPSTTCILHSHSKAASLCSALFRKTSKISFSGYEVLKGIADINTHETSIDLPIFDNTQDMKAFHLLLRDESPKLKNQGFLMEKHGIYAWGDSFLEAKRHLEIFEFLMDCELSLLQIK